MRSRSIAIDVTRNMTMNGNSPHSGGADRLEDLLGGRRTRSAAAPAAPPGTTSSSAIGPRVVPDLPQHAPRGRERDPGAHAAPARSITARNARPRSCCARPRRAAPAASSASSMRAVAHQQQPVALAPPRPSRGSRRAASRPRAASAVERLPQLGAQHRVEADRRLVEHEQLRAAEQRARERHARALAARQRGRRAGPRGAPGRRSRAPRRTARPLRAGDRARSSAGSPRSSGRRTPTAPA